MASVRPESHPGDPMTAANPEPITESECRAEAEHLLDVAATAAETLGAQQQDPATAALVLQVIATAGAGYAQLAAIDAMHEQANRGAALAGDVLAQLNLSGEPDLILDEGEDVWVRKSLGSFTCMTSAVLDRPAQEIRDAFGPCREYVLRPPRPAG